MNTEYRSHRQKIRQAGLYTNLAETVFAIQAKQNRVEIHRRGYPDFMIIRDDEIVGFVEVKPTQERPLRKGQERFARFCEKHNIPFEKWSPDDAFPTF